MLLNEALWLKHCLATTDLPLSPLCNLGSSTLEFRTKGQFYIDQHVFAPLRERGIEVVHVDLKPADGVDVVGDILDPAVRESLKAKHFRSVICTSLLEHVKDPRAVCDAICDVLGNGEIFVSVPRDYPYHEDPIDTMFRPTLAELIGLFPSAIWSFGGTVKCGPHSVSCAVIRIKEPAI